MGHRHGNWHCSLMEVSLRAQTSTMYSVYMPTYHLCIMKLRIIWGGNNQLQDSLGVMESKVPWGFLLSLYS